VVVTGTITDVTARKREANWEAARDKMEAVSALASGIAHDFNNLLTAMTGQLELLSESFDAGAKARPEIDGVLRSLDRIAAVSPLPAA